MTYQIIENMLGEFELYMFARPIGGAPIFVASSDSVDSLFKRAKQINEDREREELRSKTKRVIFEGKI